MRKFKTESKKLLNLMIHSIYTNQEIFLRELISNASDAIDKLYFASLTDDNIKIAKDDFKIKISFNQENRTLTISDNGIGMDATALEKNLGTIAHSGSLEFKEENAQAQGGDVDVIGQFGVGFYSSFMVASKLRVESLAYGSDQANAWESDGIEGYTISACSKSTHGTEITLFLKEDGEEGDFSQFLREYTIKDLIKKYSNYVRYPVTMDVQKRRELPEPENAPEDYKPAFETYTEEETINSMVPIWKRSASELSEDDYNEFYKSDFHDFENPLSHFSIKAEGALSYDALLFIPARAPHDLYSKEFKKGLALYSSNVLIDEKCEGLLPDYYNFVRGVVESQDISLNISRETLQENKQLRAIASRIEKKITTQLKSMMLNDRSAYEKFFENFGRGLEFGIYSSYGMKKDQLAELLLFYSAKLGKMITLDEYAMATDASQSEIFYAMGASREQVLRLPIVKSVLAKGFDVLVCTQDVDEFCFSVMQNYEAEITVTSSTEANASNGAESKDGNDAAEASATEPKVFEFKNVASGDLDLNTEEEKEQAKEAAKDNAALFDAMKAILGDKVSEVTVSSRLTSAQDAAACIAAQGPVSFEMERVLAQNPDGENAPKSTKVLELNAKHGAFEALRAAHDATDAGKLNDFTKILFDQAMLVEGFAIEDPVEYTNMVTRLMK